MTCPDCLPSIHQVYRQTSVVHCAVFVHSYLSVITAQWTGQLNTCTDTTWHSCWTGYLGFQTLSPHWLEIPFPNIVFLHWWNGYSKLHSTAFPSIFDGILSLSVPKHSPPQKKKNWWNGYSVSQHCFLVIVGLDALSGPKHHPHPHSPTHFWNGNSVSQRCFPIVFGLDTLSVPKHFPPTSGMDTLSGSTVSHNCWKWTLALFNRTAFPQLLHGNTIMYYQYSPFVS